MKCNRDRVGEYFPFVHRREFYVARRAAAAAIEEALRVGVLVRQPCEVCGSKRRTAEAHHDDYSKPLDVKWLCRWHHRERDRALAEARGRLAREAHKRLSASFPAVRERALEHLRSRKFRNGHPATQALVMSTTQSLFDALESTGQTHMSVAKHLKVSRQRVSQVMHGGIRSLATLAVYADAAGFDVHIELRPRVRRESAA